MLYLFKPDQNQKNGQQRQISKAQNVISASSAGYTKLLIKNGPGQPGKSKKLSNNINQTGSHNRLKHTQKILRLNRHLARQAKRKPAEIYIIVVINKRAVVAEIPSP